jgi:ABC-type transport system involved in multi-copper enzyme maturation permease subunit
MSSSEIIYVWRWLIADTFRQARVNRLLWLMLGASAVVIFFCLSVSIERGETLRPPDDIELRPATGNISLAFGAWKVPLFRDGNAAVHFLLLLLSEWVAGAGGTLFALVWTAGFMPDFLRPANAINLLSKPVPRWVLLLGKYLGVLTFVGFQVTVFIVGTWLAMGLRTGFWIDSYLWGIPILLSHFAAVYGFSVLLAVLSRSTLVCVFGSVLFWFLCWGANYGRHMLVALEPSLPKHHWLLQALAETGYWILPKPVDLGIILHRALDAGEDFGSIPELQKVQEIGAFCPELSVLSCLGFALCMIVVSTRQLADTDY